MSHKTAYSTFSDPDLSGLEAQVNDFIKSLHKNEHHEDVKVHDISTLNVKDNFIAAITYSFTKKKQPGTTPSPEPTSHESLS